SYTYDADGNLIRVQSGTDVTTYSYDPNDRLIAVSHGTDSQTYTYDAQGSLVASTNNGVVTQYLIDPAGLGNVVGQYNSAGKVIARYDYGLALVSQIDASGHVGYYDFDAIGSTVGISGGSGSYLNTYSFAPFGE